MRFKITTIFFCFILLVSCQTQRSLPLSDDGWNLCLYGVMVAGEPHHTVYVCRSYARKVESLTGEVAVSVSVNGTPVSVCYEKGISGVDQLSFQCELTEGDEIFLRVANAGRSAEARTMIPPACHLSAMDTSSLFNRGTTYLQVRDYHLVLHVNRSTDAYYLFRNADLEVSHYEGKTGTVYYEGTVPSSCRLDESSLPVDSTPFDLPDTFGGELGLPGKSTVPHWVIIDGGNVDNPELKVTYSVQQYTGVRENEYAASQYYQQWKMHSTVVLQVQTLSPETYWYYAALNTRQRVTDDIFSEPVVLVSNVSGGTGFLGAAHQTVFRQPLADCLLREDYEVFVPGS